MWGDVIERRLIQVDCASLCGFSLLETAEIQTTVAAAGMSNSNNEYSRARRSSIANLGASTVKAGMMTVLRAFMPTYNVFHVHDITFTLS